MACRGEKYTLIYREKSHIFNLCLRVLLLLFSKEKLIAQYKNSAGLPAMEEGYLLKYIRVFNYLS